MKKRSRAVSLSVDWDNIVKDEAVAKADARFGGPGHIEFERPTVEFCTGSSYCGKWNGLGMTGFGEFVFPYGVVYEGGMEDGMFHGDGTLMYPMGQKLDGTWQKGKLMSYKFSNVDGLDYDTPWTYCQMPDRRFNVSLRESLQPAGREYLTNQQPSRVIDEGCYDTGDGFYNPLTSTIMRARDPQDYENLEEGALRRFVAEEDEDFWGHYVTMVSAEQEKWTVNHCRKAWDEPSGYRPEFYEDWITGRQEELEELQKKYLVKALDTDDDVDVNENVLATKSEDEPEEDVPMTYAGTGRKLARPSK